MRCDFCGAAFAPSETRRACGGCPLAGMCDRYKCPRCGYEVLLEPDWVKVIRFWGGKIFGRRKANVRV